MKYRLHKRGLARPDCGKMHMHIFTFSLILFFSLLFTGVFSQVNNNVQSNLEEFEDANILSNQTRLLQLFDDLDLPKINPGIGYWLSWIRIPHGSVGMVFTQRAMEKKMLTQGLHYLNGWTTEIKIIDTQLQQDRVPGITCTDKNGTFLKWEPAVSIFNKILIKKIPYTVYHYGVEYDNVWVFQKVQSIMNHICTLFTFDEMNEKEYTNLDELVVKLLQEEQEKGKTGIVIYSAILPKPTPPPAILESKNKIAEAKAQGQLIQQNQKVEEEKNKLLMLQLEGENKRELAAMEMAKKKAEIDNEIKIEAGKAIDTITRNNADAISYQNKKVTADLAEKLALPDYAKMKIAEAMSQNAKFFGQMPLVYGDFFQPTGAGNIPVGTSELADIFGKLKSG